jgi:L,D-transpeptidase-like protein
MPVRHSRLIVAVIGALLALFARTALAIDPDPAALKRGEYVWHPEIAPDGPVVVVVSLDEQRAYVYRNGIGIGVTTISSGRKGHETPTGVFNILQKRKIHFSNLYDDAPMPYMERLTWDGLALHGGTVPGYPASHGCVRLPQAFAQKLFDVTSRGITVVVANTKSAPSEVVHPAMIAPVSASGAPHALSGPELAYTWNDTLAPGGAVSILVSTRDHSLFVFRGGRQLGMAKFSATEPAQIGGSVLYVMGDHIEYEPSMLDPSRPKHHWDAYPIASRAGPQPRVDVAETFRVPDEFARRIYDILAPGTTVLVTDLAATRPGKLNARVRILESSGTMKPAR